jgi:hypothetical protein
MEREEISISVIFLAGKICNHENLSVEKYRGFTTDQMNQEKKIVVVQT